MTTEERREYMKKWCRENKEKVKEYYRKKRAEDPEKFRRRAKKFYHANREKVLEQRKQKRLGCPELGKKAADYHQRKKARVRSIALAHYGPDGRAACCRCGIDDPDVLSLDHVDHSGAEHRRRDPNARKLLFWVVANGLPPGFQTLCMNCNWKKHVTRMRERLGIE